MITIEPFYKKYDKMTIDEWLSLREHPPVAEVPELGFMAYESGRPVAAGFLRRCEGNYVILDSLVTNPNVIGSIRDKAIDMLVSRLIESAIKLKVKQVVAFTMDVNTLIRSRKHGFKHLPHTAIALDLGE